MNDNLKYRYILSRTSSGEVAPLYHSHKYVAWVMLNPSSSKQDTTICDDPTTKKVIELTQRQTDYKFLKTVNLFPVYGSQPNQILTRKTDHELGYKHLHQTLSMYSVLAGARDVVCAWGNSISKASDEHKDTVLEKLFQRLKYFGHEQVFTLGTTQNGHPYHPAYFVRNQNEQVSLRCICTQEIRNRMAN